MKKWILTLAALLGGYTYAPADEAFRVSQGFTVVGQPAKGAAPDCGCDDCDCVSCGCLAATPQEATVRITVGNAAGSGVVVHGYGGVSLILTNRHVVEGVDQSTWKVGVQRGGKAYDGWVTGKADGNDLAMVFVNEEWPAARIADAYPARGDAVTLYGFGGAGPVKATPTARTGKAVGYSAWGNGYGMEKSYEVTAVSISGDSGGGVFNEAGELVAVNWGNDGLPGRAATVSYTVGLTRVRTYTRVKAGPRFPRLARLLSRTPTLPPEAPAAKPPVVQAPAPKPIAPVTPKAEPKAVAPAAPAPPKQFQVQECPNGKCPLQQTQPQYMMIRGKLYQVK